MQNLNHTSNLLFFFFFFFLTNHNYCDFQPVKQILFPQLMIGLLLSFTAPGEGPNALPQAAECPDCPGLPQTQTGQ